MDDKVDKYIEWVISKIEMIQGYTKKLSKRDINIQDVKEILSQRVHVTLILNSEYQRYRTQLTSAKREYSIWWAEKFTEKRKELNPSSLPGSKWASKGDLENEVISSFTEDYRSKQEEIDFLEERTAFMRRLMEDWNSVSYDCGSLVKLLEMETYLYTDVSGKSEVSKRQRVTN